jgi:hypothetical protein
MFESEQAEVFVIHLQHMQKALKQMNLRLDNVVWDISVQTGMRIIKATLGGERDAEKLGKIWRWSISGPRPSGSHSALHHAGHSTGEAATRKDTAVDHLSRVSSLLLQSMPRFWLGLALILIFALWLQGLLPSYGSGSLRVCGDFCGHQFPGGCTLYRCGPARASVVSSVCFHGGA